MKKEDVILFSGGAVGAESVFGENAERLSIDEVNFSFEGREFTRTRGLRILNHEELKNGDVSLDYIAKLMNRTYPHTPTFQKILQTIWHQINNSQEIFVIGEIMEDKTVKGGTGWGAEFAKLCNKKLYVFDQNKNQWYQWSNNEWFAISAPLISENHFCGTGTRQLNDTGVNAINELFIRSFE